MEFAENIIFTETYTSLPFCITFVFKHHHINVVDGWYAKTKVDAPPHKPTCFARPSAQGGEASLLFQKLVQAFLLREHDLPVDAVVARLYLQPAFPVFYYEVGYLLVHSFY